MNDPSDELHRFKSINLVAYAASVGYSIDPKASSRRSVTMKALGGDKIVVTRQSDGHFVYFNVHDPRDPGGTIIDFVQHRQSISLGQVRLLLRPLLGAAPDTAPRPFDQRSVVSPVSPARDLVSVRATFERMRLIEPDNLYLVQHRGIPFWMIEHPRLLRTIRTDDRGNVCFAHTDMDGVCGFEVKNRGFTGFASGGVKGLWSTAPNADETRLAVAESAIDAMSYAALQGIEGTRLVSIAGQMNSTQPALVRLAMDALPAGGCVIAAMDHDAGGKALAAKVHEVFVELGRTDLTFVMDPPPIPGTDWNDELRRLADSGPSPSPG